MKMNKKILSTLATAVLSAALASAATFSGLAGLEGKMSSAEDSGFFDPVMSLTGFFQGQFNITQNFLFRTELSITTSDVIETKLTEDTEAVFCFDELSATYIKPFLGITQYFSVFKGTYEPVGSGHFLERQFGTGTIASSLSDSYYGNKCASPFSIYGLGGAYIAHINTAPIAAGLYVYKNNENDEGIRQLNADLRYACAFDFITVDAILGVGAPMKTENGDEDVILLIDEVYLHTGLDMLLGNKLSPASLFVQFGFGTLPIKGGDANADISSDQIYLILEPRFSAESYKAHISLFSIPEKEAAKMEILEKNNTLGINVNIFTDKLYIKNRNFTFGFNTTLSFLDKDFMDLKDISSFFDEDENFAVKISPYLGFPIMSGELKMMLQARLNGFSSDDEWQHHFKLNIGYKKLL